MINIDENLLEISKKCEKEIKTELRLPKFRRKSCFPLRNLQLNQYKFPDSSMS